MSSGGRHLEDRQRIDAPEGASCHEDAVRLAKPGLRRRYLLASATLALATFLFAGVAPPAHADFESGVTAFDGGDFTTALNEWLPLAAGGDPFAQRNIGHLYRLGLGVPQNFEVAFNWYRRAADQGLVRAQANLANMLLRGQGVDQDTSSAAEWFHRAASAGHAISQFNIGQMYRKGLAVPQDTSRALGWFQLAADAGHERSIELVAIMSAEGIEPADDDTLLETPFGESITSTNQAPSRDEPPAEDQETARLDDDDDEDDPFASLLGEDDDQEEPRIDDIVSETEPAPIAEEPEAELVEDDLLGGEDATEEVASLPTVESDASGDAIIGGESEGGEIVSQPEQDNLAGTDDDLISGDDLLGDDEEPEPAPSEPQVASTTPEPLTRQPRISDEAMAAAVSTGLRAYQSKDYTTALRTWLPLAEAGNRDAQFYLGGLYMDGAGVTEDRVRAHAWWRLAADQGHGRASEFLEVIVAIMSAEQLTAARDLAVDLRAAIQ